MSKTISIDGELYRKLASYGNRDESHNTIIARLIEHVDHDAAQEDRLNRTTTWEGQDEDDGLRGNHYVEELADGTPVRFKIERGYYAGEERTGEVSGGRIEYDGSTWTPSGMAREADKDIRGADARDSEAYNGPREVDYQNENGEWVPLESVLG